MKRVLTYGTFDLLHRGHVRLLERAAALGDELIVGLSTDEFNRIKGKHAYIVCTHTDRQHIHNHIVCAPIRGRVNPLSKRQA